MNPEIKKFISNLGEYIARTRRAGHTTLLMKGAMEYDRPFFVVGMNMQYATQLARATRNRYAIPISISNFDTSSRAKIYPLIIDNSVLQEFLYFDMKSDYSEFEEDLKLNEEDLKRNEELKIEELKLQSLQPIIDDLQDLRDSFKPKDDDVQDNWYLGLPNY